MASAVLVLETPGQSKADGYKGGTFARGIVPSKVLVLWATDAPKQVSLSHGQDILSAGF
jgi:hypothetical protein